MLVVDANVVLSAVLGIRTRRALGAIGALRLLVMSAQAEREVRLVAGDVLQRRGHGEAQIDLFLASIEIVPAERYGNTLSAAEIALRNAVASRNGSERGAHVLALAWTLEADIWSHDRDFAGTGWPSWSSTNLLAALIAAGQDA